MSINPTEAERHNELAEFLRSRRARLSPEQVGLPRGTRRRTPGLRREEVARLAGISPEWYTWLEQGRHINVSLQLLESLARVLKLDTSEREHLFLLAVRQSPPVETYSPPTVSAAVQRFLDQLTTTPACALDARINVVAQNAAHRAVFFSDEVVSERDRNLIWRLFTYPRAAEVNKEWDELARVYLAQFRAGYGRFISDPWWAERIAELSQVSPKFRELWAEHEVLNISEGHKTFVHPLVGELCFDFIWFQAVDSSDLRVLIHTPRLNTGTAEKIEQLLVSTDKA